MSVLDDIVAGVREDLSRRRSETSEADLRARLLEVPPALDPMPAFRGAGSSVIAEVKRRSPSKGDLADIPDPAALASAYQRGGAAAVSVLTEERRFGGSLDDLRAVRAAVAIPVLRKDFVVEPYQLLEARAAGADAVLLIVAVLTDDELRRLRRAAGDLGLDTLVEVHDDEELARALDAGAEVIGVNNRNLRTLTVDVEASERLIAGMPADVVAVSESGLKTAADIERLQKLGYRAFLIGERFMTAPDPGALLAGLVERSA